MDETGWRSLQLGVLLLGVAGLITIAGAGTAADTAGPFGQTNIDADTVLMDVAVDAEGTGEWEVVYRMELADDEEIAAFEELQTEIETNTSAYLGPFEERMDRTVASAEETTGREMRVDGFTVDAERESQPQAEFGVVTYRFEWRGFAAVDGERIQAGDALDQLFLDENTGLRLSWPDGYTRQSSTPQPTTVEAQRVTWQGPIDFDAGEPRLVVTSGDTSTPTDTETTPGSGDTSDGESFSILSVLVVLALGLVAVVAGLLLYRNDSETESEPTAGGERQDTGPPAELLSNEERVRQLLEDSGGRLKQKEVADQLDWTAAKTSQVVSDLREEGEVESFRLGRENVLTLPDVDIDGSDTDDAEES